MIQLTRILPDGTKNDQFWINEEQVVWIEKFSDKIIIMPANGPDIETDAAGFDKVAERTFK